MRACFYPQNKYKPGFAFKTLEGFRDETFEIPFEFTVPGTGAEVTQLPLQLDDDVPWILRGIVFPQLGIPTAAISTIRNIGACRIRDTKGNPLSKGKVLTLGAWCQSGYANVNAFGWWFTDEIICDPGGALLFDFQLSTNATWAIASVTNGGDTIIFDANIYGVAGNAYTINLLDPGAPNVALSVAAGAGVVNVTLATDGASAIISTSQQVIDAINESSAAVAVLTAQLVAGTGNDVVAAAAEALGGAAASSPVNLRGTLLGVKRFRECL